MNVPNVWERHAPTIRGACKPFPGGLVKSGVANQRDGYGSFDAS
jgi:hypothetical protein